MSNRTPFIGGNWKLHHTVPAAIALASEVVDAWEALASTAASHAAFSARVLEAS